MTPLHPPPGLGWAPAVALLVLGLAAKPVAAEPAAPAQTKIGAFVTSLSDIQESQRRFDISLWVSR